MGERRGRGGINDVVIGGKCYFWRPLISDRVEGDGGREGKEGGGGRRPKLLPTASGFRLRAPVGRNMEGRHTCHPDEIILQGCGGGNEHDGEMRVCKLASVCVCVCEPVLSVEDLEKDERNSKARKSVC